MAGFQAFADYIICEKPIENVVVNGQAVGYEFEIKYPSYRGTYVSCIEKLEIAVDGREIDPKDLRFCLNHKEFLFAQIPELYSEYWFIHDNAVIRVFQEDGLAKDRDHEVSVRIVHRIPYTGYFGDYLVLDSANTKKLQVL
ncbi:MAG TPA: hypothetical protein GXX75_14680 [Clostridiales bacterium]|nr:hypothetical protein [Clostridiales bacterium]